MGNPTAEASTGGQSAFVDRHEHYATLQGAASSAGFAVDGQVGAASPCAVPERYARQGCAYWASQRWRSRSSRCAELEPAQHRRAGIQAVQAAQGELGA